LKKGKKPLWENYSHGGKGNQKGEGPDLPGKFLREKVPLGDARKRVPVRAPKMIYRKRPRETGPRSKKIKPLSKEEGKIFFVHMKGPSRPGQ